MESWGFEPQAFPLQTGRSTVRTTTPNAVMEIRTPTKALEELYATIEHHNCFAGAKPILHVVIWILRLQLKPREGIAPTTYSSFDIVWNLHPADSVVLTNLTYHVANVRLLLPLPTLQNYCSAY